MSRLFLFSLLLILASCQKKYQYEPSVLFEGQNIDFDQALMTIALGSCNRQDKPQDMWPVIDRHDPQLWIWLGDNIYGDSENMNVLLEKYQQQKNGVEYSAFRKNRAVIGIWDDHDYGVNDGDKNYSKKEESKQLMLDFLDVPKNDAVRKRPGAYQSYVFGEKGKKVKVILLDGRYFRDELEKNTAGDRRYLPNPEGDILGEAQWQWLEKELTRSDAQIHLIGCGIQFIPEEHGYEKWANFPASRDRLFQLLEKAQPAHTLLVSGDRHISELSRMDLEGLGYPLYELTASGMTHSWSDAKEDNKHRVGQLVTDLNFGLLKIDWSGAEPKMVVEVRGNDDATLLREELAW